MKLRDARELIYNRGDKPPYGERRLRRVYSVEDLRRSAVRRIAAGAMAYAEGGGEDEITLRRNIRAFEDYELLPHVMQDVHAVDLRCELLGTAVPLPIALGPIGSSRLFHHDGEIASVQAASRAGIPFTLSSAGTSSIEDVSKNAACPLWYQLYVWTDRALVKDLLARADEARYTALVVTVDAAVHSKRERELRSGIRLPNPALRASTILEASVHPNWWWHFLTGEPIRFTNLSRRDENARVGFDRLIGSFDGSFDWDDLEWIRSVWKGKVVLKGIQTVDDARRAAATGVDAIVVSNHGGRQLDRVPASIESLGPISGAVGEDLEVLFDGGIRRGSDILTALALGARGCLLGRAYVYGLAAAGEAGVLHAIDILTTELRTVMALVGARSVAELGGGYVRRRGSDRGYG